jgi:hypothetical protein
MYDILRLWDTQESHLLRNEDSKVAHITLVAGKKQTKVEARYSRSFDYLPYKTVCMPLDLEPSSSAAAKADCSLDVSATPMKITDLDYDALSLLSALVAPSDVNSWRLVCRTLGHAAHPYRFRRLALRDPGQLRDACASVAQTPGCAQHILYLTMGNGCFGSPNEPGDPNIRDALTLRIAELMYSTVNLVSLTMKAAESFLADNSALVAAVAACSRLETLVLNQRHWDYDYLSHGTALLFAALHAPLRSLELGKLAGDEFPVHVLVLLQHFVPTLETLDLDFVEIGPWREDRPAPVFSYVTELVMRTASVHTQTLERAFPALHELSLEFKDAHFDPLIPTFHADNLLNAPAHWKDLALLSGDIGGLWTLQLRNVEIDLLVIHGYAHDEEKMEARRAVLRGVRPHMLHVWVCADTEGETMLAHDLPEHATSVRILDLNITYRTGPWGEIYDAQGIMTFLVRTSALVRHAPDGHHLILRPAQHA